MGASGAAEVTLGAITQFYPVDLIDRILDATQRQSKRKRRLPAPLLIYYIIALGLYVSEGGRSVLRRVTRRTGDWLESLSAVCSDSAISQARTRLGSEPMRQLYAAVVRPLATKKTVGAWYRRWRVVSLDGTTLDVADSDENEREFGRPGVFARQCGLPSTSLADAA